MTQLVALFCVLSALLSPIFAVANEKHAALVIDADSGAVIHAENSTKMRYPASLTKLMTLYLTFDALRQGTLTMKTTLKASKKAASMPSTNLRLKPGDTIKVRDAIKALVVRSANDVAVILAEKLGGNEVEFAKQMTQAARRLGMQKTTFRNASGLPDNRQQSTARDLATLAMALKRHFPEYYHYFRTTEFSYKGRKYKSHNRAMQRISGADGLKTGYINASGFNLITTAKRGRKSLIAVILGGKSSKARDDEMVQMVENSFSRLRLRGNRRQFVFGENPVPQEKPAVLLHERRVSLVKTAAADVKKTDSTPQATRHEVVSQPILNIDFDRVAPSYIAVNTSTQVSAPKQRGQFQAASYTTSKPATSNGEWGIQVGAYYQSREALVAAANAASKVPQLLADARIHVADTYQEKGQALLHRARLTDMSKEQAERACKTLRAMAESCFVFQRRDG